jgi:hypothetical protein
MHSLLLTTGAVTSPCPSPFLSVPTVTCTVTPSTLTGFSDGSLPFKALPVPSPRPTFPAPAAAPLVPAPPEEVVASLGPVPTLRPLAVPTRGLAGRVGTSALLLT